MWRFFMPDDESLAVAARRRRVVFKPLAVGLWLGLLTALTPGVNGAGDPAPALTTRLTGVVLDASTGSPVANATVLIVGTGYVTVTDAEGRFSFSTLPAGIVSVQARCVGYRVNHAGDIRLEPSHTARITIRMETRVYRAQDAIVEATETSSPGGPIVIDRDDMEQVPVKSLPRILETVPGVFVQQDGSGGQSQVRIRGSLPTQVLVLLDGQRLNQAANGLVDLSSIPFEMVERIEVFTTGASARFGPDALGGAINIITDRGRPADPCELSVTGGTGSFGRGDYVVSATDPLNRPDLSVRATYSRTVSDGDWAYDYRPDGLSGPADSYSGRRANNAFRRTNVFATGSWRPSSRAAFRLSFQSYRAAAGLPGPVSRPTATARSNDGRTLVNATFETDSRTIGQFETTVAFSDRSGRTFG
jgi:outer membrane receptor protein involved in Fe transport